MLRTPILEACEYILISMDFFNPDNSKGNNPAACMKHREDFLAAGSLLLAKGLNFHFVQIS